MKYIELNNLKVALRQSKDEWVIACRGVNLEVKPGLRYAVIGESGCGKSVTIKAAMGYLRPSPDVYIHAETMRFFDGENGSRTPAEMAKLWRRDVVYIPQDNMNALDPIYTAEEIVKSRYRLALEERGLREPKAIRRATEMKYQEMAQRGLSLTRSHADPSARISNLPVEWYSGGMRQLVFLSIAMMVKPQLLVVDEGTTALDAIKEERYFSAIIDKQNPSESSDAGVLFISHDINLAKSCSDFIYVLYAGVVIEAGPSKDVLDEPRHPYTKMLIDANNLAGTCQGMNESGELFDNRVYSTSLPDPSQFVLKACPFRNRCPAVTEKCAREMPEEKIDEKNKDRQYRCFNPCSSSLGPQMKSVSNVSKKDGTILEIKNCNVSAYGRKILTSIDLDIGRSETVGLVGGSGHGKSTLVKALLGLPGYKVYGRESCVKLDGTEIGSIPRRSRRHLMQYVPQIINDSFLKHVTVSETLVEPLFADAVNFYREIQKHADIVQNALSDVGLPGSLSSSRVVTLSGGQQQRISIARALIALGVYSGNGQSREKLLLLDEPTSSLDASVRADILMLLRRLQQQHSLAYLFISHDLDVVLEFCNRIYIVYFGTIIEDVPAEEVVPDAELLHPNTRDLFGFSSHIIADPVPDFSNVPRGCRYSNVCSLVVPECCKTAPLLKTVGSKHRIACYRNGINVSEKGISQGMSCQQ